MNRRLPAVKPKEVIRALERAGFVVRRVTGSHYRMSRSGDPTRWVVVPYHTKDLKKGTLHSILDQAGLSPEEFLDLLER